MGDHPPQNRSPARVEPTALAITKAGNKLLAERGISTVIAISALAFFGWVIVRYLDLFIQSQRDIRETIERNCRSK